MNSNMCKTIQQYKVAGHVFAIEATPEQLAKLSNYTPFIADENDATNVFTMRLSDLPLPAADGWEHVHTDSTEDNLPRIEIYRRADEWLVRMTYTSNGEIVCAMRGTDEWQEVTLYLLPEALEFAVDNMTMLTYAFRTLSLKTLLFHASVTMRGGKGYMFLGHSGTGKSTHSQQWLHAFTDAELLNDDNPVVRLLSDETVQVYGSPWSGKTPCYKNKDVPVGALVQLVQAPHNTIQRLKMTQAYPYILASVCGLKLQPDIMDRLYESIAQLLELCPVYKLECLPNLEAAQLCAQTCLS